MHAGRVRHYPSRFFLLRMSASKEAEDGTPAEAALAPAPAAGEADDVKNEGGALVVTKAAEACGMVIGVVLWAV